MTPVDSLPDMDASIRDRYVIERELGHGGMATVYLARDTRHDRLVAIKVLSPALALSLGVERFLLEIRVMARLQHAHILPLLDSGLLEPAQQKSPFYVMPYVEGESLRDRLRREHQLPIADALKIAGDVANALAYAHGQGVIHRDIKPENILLSNGQAIVADFGIASAASTAGGARLTETGMTLGTPHYMSPEQASGDRSLDGRTDIYALGCVLYEMLAGEPPFNGPTPQAILARVLVESPPPVRRARPAVSEEIERIIARSLARVHADRFATADEMGAAIAAASTAPVLAAPRQNRPWKAGVVIVTLILVAAIVALLRREGRTANIIAPAASIAVLPFTPSGPDTALSRLGRDLVFTLSAELDGLGGIRMVDAHTVLASAKTEELGATPDWSAQGRRLGAGSVVQGSLVRVGSDVRLDMALLGADSAAPLARATVTASPDSVAALTDSAARALLAQIWSRGTPPTPSLDAALRTRSVVALRAFLQGENELTHGQWDAAAESYGRAVDADSAFWMAAARYVYARYWSQSEPADSVVTRLDRHIGELPERERLITQAILLQDRDSIARALELARTAGERYGDSWFGWLFYGDAGLHNGPILGHSIAEARVEFERAVALNAELIPVWEHLLLIMLIQNDTAGTARALENFTRLDAGPILTADGYGNRMVQFRYLAAVQRGDSAGANRLVDSLAGDPAPAAVGDGSFYDPYRFGYYAEQIQVSRKALTVGLPTERLRVHRRLLAWSWGARGALDSTLAMLDRAAADGTDSSAALSAYGIAAVGVWLDAINPTEATARRDVAVRAAGTNQTGRAEIAWLDGVLAAAKHDRRALGEARATLRQSGDPASAALDRSLGAMDAALHGSTREAGAQMAALEWEEAPLSAPDYREHPLTLALDRLAAARWILASGNPEEALRLLRWVDGAVFLSPTTPYSLMFTGLADLERGRAEEKLGHAALAAEYYRRFLRRYDRPMQRHAALVAEAKKRLGHQ